MPNNVRLEHAGGAVPTTLAADMTSAVTACLLSAATLWPTGGTGPFYIVIDPGQTNEEKILATSRTTNQLNTLIRGVDGTVASAHDAGAVVMHIFSADEADEANVLVNQFYTLNDAKGSEIVATGVGTVAALTVGANGTVRFADSTQTTGQSWVTPKVGVAASMHWGGYAGTCDTNGQLVVTHGAAFTPTVVQLTPFFTVPAVTNMGVPALAAAPGATTFTLQMMAITGSMNGLVIAGGFLVLA